MWIVIIIYFDSFRVEYISKKNYQKQQKTINIYRIQAYNLIMYGYFCIKFIYFMLKGKCLLDYTNLISPNKYEKNDKIIKYDNGKIRMIRKNDKIFSITTKIKMKILFRYLL